MEKSIIDYTPEEIKELDEKLDNLNNKLDDFLKDIRETIERLGL